MPGKKKLLFISHKANRSGAPALLLSIIREFKKRNPGVSVITLLMEDGELAGEFAATSTTFVWDRQQNKLKSNSRGGIMRRMFFIVRGFYILQKFRNTSLVFYNTITNGHMQRKLSFLNCRSVCYVHELQASINMLTNKETLGTVLRNTNAYLVVSNAVKQNLLINHCIAEEKISTVFSPVQDGGLLRLKEHYAITNTSFRENHAIPAGAIIIGICGSNEWRKGFDLLIPLVKLYFSLFPLSNVFFVWKGFHSDNASAWFGLYDYEKSFLKDRIILAGHGSDNIEHIAMFDIHLLLSREDPYPLVVLEAASFAIPTICFASSGGTPEFIEDDCGLLANYLDLYDMAIQLNKLAEDELLRNTMGMNARRKLAERHNQQAMDTILEIIKTNLFAGVKS